MAEKKPIKVQEFKSKEERLKALKSRASANNKQLGLEGVTIASNLSPYRRSPSGIVEFDNATGGFLIHGGFVTVWGPKAAGKTTLALKTAALAQKEGKIVYWIAQENFDPLRAAWAGCNMDELMVGQFPQAEMCLDTIIDYARRKLVDVIILDSIHSMSPKAEQENSKGIKSVADNTMGLLARKLSTFFPQALDPIKRAEVAVLLIGQSRINLGPIVSLEQLSGGNALLHNSRLTIKCSRGAQDDAPRKVTWIETGEKDENNSILLDKHGKPLTKKVEEITGFPCVFKFEKVQVSGCLTEKSVLSLPYYYESGFDLPQYLIDENKEIEEAQTGTIDKKSNSSILDQALEKSKEIINDITKKAIDLKPPTSESVPVVRKRGRPKKS